MQILEILNTTVDVTWVVDGHRNLGNFTLNRNKHIIFLDEYTINDKTLIDFGFDTNDSYHAIDSGQSSPKIIGAVVNGAMPMIKQLDPEIILVSVRKDSGLVDSRKNLYTAIIIWLLKRTHYLFATAEWIENENGFYKIISKTTPTKDELQLFIDTVNMTKT